MKDENKGREQLTNDLASLQESLRQCTGELQARNQDLDDVARYVVSEFKGPLGMLVGFAELLEEGYATLSEEERRYCIRMIKQSGHRMGKMVNALLLLANSRRLFDNVWYAAYLATMGEMSLSRWAIEEEKDVSEAYRFTCLPASSAPLVIRLWRVGGQTPSFQAVAKLGSVDDAVEGNPIPQEVKWTLTVGEWSDLLVAVEGSEFWSDDSSLEQLGWSRMVGNGGEEWIFEGWRDAQHKVRMVWNPSEEKSYAAYTLGRLFIEFLPEWFALEMARSWTVNSSPEVRPRSEGEVELGSLF